MNHFEYILDLLQKESLTESEKSKIEEILKNDNETMVLYNTYIKLGKALSQASHLSFGEMKDFILVKNNLEPEDRNIFQKIPRIESHLRQCSICTEEFKMLNSEYSEVEIFLTKTYQQESNNTSQSDSKHNFFFRKMNPQYYALAAVLIIGLLFGSMFIVSELTTSSAINHASLDDKSDFYITRGRTTDYFQESIKALENEDYNSAIPFLEKDIEKNQNSETIFYSHYVLGLVQLEVAERNFFGLFPSYDTSTVEAGLKNLQLSIEKNSSGRYQNLSMNSYFYIAKAYLMLDDKESAKKYLMIVVDGKGSKMVEAKNILGELE